MTPPLSTRMCTTVWAFAKKAPPTKNTDVLQSYLFCAMSENNINVNSVCEYGCNIGFYLAGLGNVYYLKAAEKLGVDFAHRNHKEETALFYLFGAAPMLYLLETSTQPQLCVDFLLKTCALTNVNTLGQTPLFGLRKMVEKDGMFSNIILQDLRNMPSEEYPEYIHHYEKMLNHAIQCGADIAHKDHNGRSFIDLDSSNNSDLNKLLIMFDQWRNRIDKIVLTKEVSEFETVSSKRRL